MKAKNELKELKEEVARLHQKLDDMRQERVVHTERHYVQYHYEHPSYGGTPWHWQNGRIWCTSQGGSAGYNLSASGGYGGGGNGGSGGGPGYLQVVDSDGTVTIQA